MRRLSPEASSLEYWSALPAERRTIAWIRLTAAGADALAQVLSANGLPLADEGEVVLVTTDDYLHPALPAIARKETRPWLLARPVGRSVLLGPVFMPGSSPCWFCLAHWLKTRRWEQASIVGWSDDDCPPEPADAGIASTFTLAAGWIANAVTVLSATGQLPHLTGAIQRIDTHAVTVSEHPVTPGPACSHACAIDTAPPSFARWADPLLGIVDDFAMTSDVVGGFHQAKCRYYRPLPRVGARRLLRPGTAYGRGRTRERTEESCLAEALERYCTVWQGDEQVIHGTVDVAGALHPEQLLHFSDRQYRDRQDPHLDDCRRPGRVPRRLDPRAEIDWVRARSMTGEHALIPAALCYMWYPLEDSRTFGVANTNGVAAGRTRDEAIRGGLLELIERDAVAIWWYNQLARPAIRRASFRSDAVDEVLGALDRDGVDGWLLDITTDIPIPTYVAIGLDRKDQSVHLGSASDFNPGIAAERALGEMSQMWFWSRQSPDANGVRNRLMHGVAIESEPFLAPHGTVDPIEPLDDALPRWVDHFSARNLPVFIVDLTRPEIQLPVLRVVVPELRHCWHRLGRGRLYDVPVRMGWLDAPTLETALNPRFCPI